MKHLWGGLVAIAFAVSAMGCMGNPCDEAADRIAAKLESCGVAVTPSDPPDGYERMCSEAMGNQAQCIADCTDAASCGALDGTDTDAAVDYAACTGDC